MTNPTAIVKRCALCNEQKNLNHFFIAKSRRDGRQSYCKICVGEYGKIKSQICRERRDAEIEAFKSELKTIFSERLNHKIAIAPFLGQIRLRDVLRA